MSERYQHYKGGIYTIIVPDALNSETMERVVVYQNTAGGVWVRPYDMFHGYTETGEKRFVELDDQPRGEGPR